MLCPRPPSRGDAGPHSGSLANPDVSCSETNPGAALCCAKLFSFSVPCPTAAEQVKKPLSSSGGGCSWSPPGLCKTHGQGGRRKASVGADPALSYPVCKSRVAPLQPGESLSRCSGVRELETNPLWLFMFRLRENLIYQPLEPGEELGERSRRRLEP